ncbi:MAG: hypothetical protein U5K84_14385 [Alkalibacterium sp.]|nr:hypothetical protein [Alkalibacterium sp.]
MPFRKKTRGLTSRNELRRALQEENEELNVTQWALACLSGRKRGAETSRNELRRAFQKENAEPNVTQ